MPKIIVTSRYIKPNAHKKFGNYIKYIATREGVEKPMPKYENNRQLDREIFINYLDSRPNSHGLFSEKDKPIVLDKAAKEVANHSGAIWTHIVSLKREDAERMGYIDLEHWRDLVRRHASDIAEAQKISDDNFRWYAAFHNKESNPHVHIVVYSKDGKQGYLTKEGIEKIRSAFANDIYRDELSNLYQLQTMVRDKLCSEAKNMMTNLLSELQNNIDFGPQLEQLILKLQSQLKSSKGKKVYGYLQPNVKKTVDQIVAVLAQNSVLKKMYERWCELERQKYETYTSTVPKLPPLEENKIFKPIKNAVIKAVMDMELSVPKMETEIFTDGEKVLPQENLNGEENESIVVEKNNINLSEDYKSTHENFSDNKEAKTFSKGTDKYNQTAVRNAVMSMLFSFGRLISDDYNRSLRGQNMRTEHKLKSAIRRKKQALGIKENSIDEQKGW